MIRVLFVCLHNSARSQVAEELLRKEMGDSVLVESAGLEPGTLNPTVVELLLEEGIDISEKPTRSVFDLVRKGRTYTFVITVCEESASERCPIFPGIVQRRHWSFPDPSGFSGSNRKEQTRVILEMIRITIKEFAAELRRLLHTNSAPY